MFSDAAEQEAFQLPEGRKHFWIYYQDKQYSEISFERQELVPKDWLSKFSVQYNSYVPLVLSIFSS